MRRSKVLIQGQLTSSLGLGKAAVFRADTRGFRVPTLWLHIHEGPLAAQAVSNGQNKGHKTVQSLSQVAPQSIVYAAVQARLTMSTLETWAIEDGDLQMDQTNSLLSSSGTLNTTETTRGVSGRALGGFMTVPGVSKYSVKHAGPSAARTGVRAVILSDVPVTHSNLLRSADLRLGRSRHQQSSKSRDADDSRGLERYGRTGTGGPRPQELSRRDTALRIGSIESAEGRLSEAAQGVVARDGEASTYLTVGARRGPPR
ncbi:hypothetical protein EVG20_g5693 [Dentipellis fragilis]|uniref:Uncharacterized protein n=1 Tax=Dentipellis fragilis TaxID=205917 RepID=A0A4Y9YUE3_9AGAM|nr:hypothetical protein EVG20_g5693 [Dentipellis fragilis]